MKWTPTIQFTKDPADVLDYTLDFGALLKLDTIASITVEATHVTVDSSSFTGNVVTMFISGGTACQEGVVKTTIVTTNATPRTFERSFRIAVKDL